MKIKIYITIRFDSGLLLLEVLYKNYVKFNIFKNPELAIYVKAVL